MGNKVYLLIKNLKMTWLSKRLSYKRVGLFIIQIKKSNVDYELELLEEIHIYPIFYISLLKLVHPKILI